MRKVLTVLAGVTLAIGLSGAPASATSDTGSSDRPITAMGHGHGGGHGYRHGGRRHRYDHGDRRHRYGYDHGDPYYYDRYYYDPYYDYYDPYYDDCYYGRSRYDGYPCGSYGYGPYSVNDDQQSASSAAK